MQLELFDDIKVGDIVQIRPKSVYYVLNDATNPRGTNGVVININNNGFVTVKWDNGYSNTYSDFDLDIQRQLPDIPSEVCTCEIRKVVNFGCECEAGQAELKRERG